MLIQRIKIVSFSFILILLSFYAKSQEYEQENPKSFRDKLFFGGGLTLQFGTITQVGVSPQVGYYIVPRIAIGVGASYDYYKDSHFGISSSIYGGSVFTKIFIIQSLFLHGEVEVLNHEDFSSYNASVNNSRIWDTGILVGGGYRQQLGGRAAINYMILWNINETSKSIYTNPIIRIGFNF
jgi:hypothetical protein